MFIDDVNLYHKTSELDERNAWNPCGMMLKGKAEILGDETCSSAIVFTTNPTWTGLESNTAFHGGTPGTKALSRRLAWVHWANGLAEESLGNCSVGIHFMLTKFTMNAASFSANFPNLPNFTLLF